MRMISDRDERIINELGSYVHNDMDVISMTLDEVERQSSRRGRRLSMQEAIEIAKRLSREVEPEVAA